MSCLSILQYLLHLSATACFIIKAPFFYTRHARGRRLCQNMKGDKQGLSKRSKRQEIINQLQFLQILLQHRETQLLLIISRFQWPKNQSTPVQQKYVNSILRSVCAYPCIMKCYSMLIIFSTCFLPITFLENKLNRQKNFQTGIVCEQLFLQEFSVLQCKCKYLL